MEKDIDFFRNHPIYGIGYDSVVSFLGTIEMHDGVVFSDQDFLDVFLEAESCVEKVVQSKMPEIDIPRVFASLKRKYQSEGTRSGYLTSQLITHHFCIGCIIQMLFLIVSFDQIPEKSERIKNAFIDVRAFIENMDVSYIYKNDAMWKLIAERVPTIKAPRVEDLRATIVKLNEELEQYKTGNASFEWHEIVERTVEPLDKIWKPAGFYDIPKIKALSRPSQCELVLKLRTSSMPFTVALFHEIEFMEQMKLKETYKTETSRLKLIASVLSIKYDNRELKGNFNVLKPNSKEDPSKYTSGSLLGEAKAYYTRLLDRPN